MRLVHEKLMDYTKMGSQRLEKIGTQMTINKLRCLNLFLSSTFYLYRDSSSKTFFFNEALGTRKWHEG